MECRVLAGRGRVVVHHVHHDPQPRAVERADHLAELPRARRAVRVRAVRTLRRRVVQRVVAPVEAVRVADRLDAGLLLRRRGPERLEVARRGLLGVAALLDARDVVGRQQVHGVQPGTAQVPQLPHAGAVPVGERQVGAPVRGGYRTVADREVAHLQLVDRRVLGLGQRPACAAGPSRPARSAGSSRSVSTERAEFVVSPSEYGSVTTLVTTSSSAGTYTRTSKA